jgi:O-antigen/teichoic acid export membrane protein
VRISIASRLFLGRSLTTKAYLNALAATIDFSTRFVVSFLVTPLLVVGLGDAVFGIWKVLQNATSYLTIAGGRSPHALKWFVASRQASNEVEEKRQAVGGAVAVWMLLLPLQAILAAVIVWFLPSWLGVSPELVKPVRLAGGLAAAGLILSGLTGISRSSLEGQNLAYKRILLSPALAILGGGLTVGALHLELGIVGVAAAGLATLLITGLCFLIVAKINVPWFGIAMPTRETIRHFFGLSWWFLAWHLIIRLMVGSDVILLGTLATAELVTVYTLTRYLPEAIFRFVANVVFETTPGLGVITGRGELERAAKVRGEVMLLSWLAITTVGSTLLLWNESFLKLWVGSEYYGGWLTTLLIMVMVSQFLLIRYDGNIIDLSLDLRWKVLLGTISTVLSLALSFVLIRWLDAGINGLCVGFIVGRLLLSIGYPIMVGRKLEIHWSTQVSFSIRPVLVLAAAVIFCHSASDYFTADTWFRLAVRASVTFVVATLIVFFAGLNSNQRRQIVSRATRGSK